jgi:hypothetical protein
VRRTSTWARRRRPLTSWPWVASRRLSWATTRWTAARSCSGPLGSARSSSLSGRAGGSCWVRSIWPRSSSRRRNCSKARIWSRVSGGSGGSPGWSSRTGVGGSERSPSARRMRWTSTPKTPEPSPRRPSAAIASRARSRIAASSPPRIARKTCSRRLSRSIRRPSAAACASPSASSPPVPSRRPWRSAPSSAARKKWRSKTRSKTRRSSGDLASVAASAARNDDCCVHGTAASAPNASLSSDVPMATPSARRASPNSTTRASKPVSGLTAGRRASSRA